MEMAFALLADQAVVPPDRKLYILGGGISTITAAQLPGRYGFAAIGSFRFQAAELQAGQLVELRLVDADGGLVMAPVTLRFVAGQPELPEGSEITLNTVTYLVPTFGAPGSYRAEYWGAGRLLGAAPLTVMQAPEAQAPPAALPLPPVSL